MKTEKVNNEEVLRQNAINRAEYNEQFEIVLKNIKQTSDFQDSYEHLVSGIKNLMTLKFWPMDVLRLIEIVFGRTDHLIETPYGAKYFKLGYNRFVDIHELLRSNRINVFDWFDQIGRKMIGYQDASRSAIKYEFFKSEKEIEYFANRFENEYEKLTGKKYVVGDNVENEVKEKLSGWYCFPDFSEIGLLMAMLRQTLSATTWSLDVVVLDQGDGDFDLYGESCVQVNIDNQIVDVVYIFSLLSMEYQPFEAVEKTQEVLYDIQAHVLNFYQTFPTNNLSGNMDR